MPSLILVGLIGLPLFALVWRSIGSDFFIDALSENAASALRLSLLTSIISVGLALITGTPLAYLLAHWKFPGRTLVDMLVDLPVVLPPAVAGIALLMAFGRMGIFGKWLNVIGITIPFTTTAVILAQTFVSAPFLVRSARIGFAAIDLQQQEAARMEGANEWQVFRYIMFPLSRSRDLDRDHSDLDARFRRIRSDDTFCGEFGRHNPNDAFGDLYRL